ncbi:dTMP kinase [Corynebacterium choanae]|uniref:Thymidylate kinase n=1 Tax=Corynebacterium choanae TaxID=1862358 RepID=A0A3G6J584_9CORY|nr:dTMP kinase [Corynebacterium choanae]AZA12913.1 Thymidylate kinase [Corynebacterium choanae]
MIVAIEGIDGAGKHTLVTALQQRTNATVLSFPRYSESVPAQLAQQALYGGMGDLVDSIYGMATMFALDRHGAKSLIEPFCTGQSRANEVILLDRYVASNAAYSWARAQDAALVDWVGNLEFTTLGLPVPDFHILLGTQADVARERALLRAQDDSHRQLDAYEQDSMLQERTFAAYMALAEQHWQSPWEIVRSDEDPAQVADQLVAAYHL